MDEQQITIAASLSGAITLASQQNAVPFIRDLSVVNDTLETFENLNLEFVTKPDFMTKKTWHIDRITPESAVHIRDIDVVLNGQLLNGLSEAISGEATLVLCHDKTPIAETKQSIRLLARNEWGGVGQMADLLAAFSMPNDPAVDKVLKAASLVLQRAGKNAAIDGYKSGARTHVWEMVSAIWAAIAGIRLSYALPPASFENQGQKIRTPTQIMESGLGTCLDLTLLFAAAIEQAGLNPFVVFTKSHAFVGAWLQPAQFSAMLIDDPSVIRKRAILNELVAFETTLVTQNPPASFSAAIEHAVQQLAEEKENEFELVIDIRRARMQKIRPLPAFGSSLAVEQQKAERVNAAAVALDLAPNLPNFDVEALPDGEGETPQTRLTQWQRQLLDLSLRNPLLNFQSTKGAIKLIAPDPAFLEDCLAKGKKIRISSAPEITEGKSRRSAAIHMARHNENVDETYAREALSRDEVLVKLPPDELDARVTNIYRTAKKDLEEGGANTLFIAIGFLVWKRDGTDDRKFRAPLVLLPVTLERKSVRGGVRMLLGEDEPRFNTTLLQMLRQDFELDITGLDETLPQDAHGVDVAGIWRKVREEIKDEPGFEVIEDVVLGTFSFAKYLMWKDLVDRVDQLKLNPVVKHLIETPREIYANSIAFPHQSELDGKYPPDRVFTPLPADSSQLAAIMASAAGKDFVLIGPPGTGKSQTIANMIAHNLAEGRKVLFVAEKVTALNVVYRRLKKLGLGDFCLELHSNKARKAEVLDQLRSAWASKGEFSENEWKREARRLKSLRDDLANYVNRIHAKYRNGLTPYLAIGQIVANEDVPAAKLSWPSFDQHSQEEIDHLREIVDRLDENYRVVHDLRLCGVGVIQAKDWSPSWERKLIESSRCVSVAAKELDQSAENLLVALQLDSKQLAKIQINALAVLAGCLPQTHGLDLGFAFLPNAQAKFEKFRHSLDKIDQYHAASSRLSCSYANFPWRSLDIDELEKIFVQSQASFSLKRWILQGKIRSCLKKKAGAQGRPDIENDLNILKKLRDIGKQIETDQVDIAPFPGWSGYQTDTKLGRKVLNIAIAIRRSLADYAATHDEFTFAHSAIHRVVCDGNEMLEDTASIGKLCRHYAVAHSAYIGAFGKFSNLAECDPEALREENGKNYLPNMQKMLSDIQSQEQRINAWCAWQRAKGEAILRGLGGFVSLLESGAISEGQARRSFEKSYADWWIDAVVEHDEVLRSFVSVQHERSIKAFSELDDKFISLTAKYVRAKLCGSLPAENDAQKGTELGVLRRELEKKRAHKPLRQLIAEMPSALTQIVPCLLMSPLSIAQYLAPEQALFDLVIFDEASQITVWDAIGAISRGRSVVVVGDPQQLPPTTFFSRKDDEVNASEDVEQDLSSILDECLGAGLPKLALNWHYRSKFESLIAFSNQRFYRGDLVTFPSPVTNDRAVRLVPVPDGLYDRGGSQTNRLEAEAVVAEILKRLKDPISLAKEQSIGVVTFNSKQQQLIEDLLDAARKENPELDRFFDNAAVDEPVFVKNLESVQGDERDVMLFSIAYGPDKTGAPPKMNFGPLNQQGGPRRLNVAITRARHEMLVFATLKPDQIDLSRTNAPGVRDLKHFLEMAERGPRALIELDQGSVGGYESPFEAAVATKLADLGWQLLPQIGVSTFRIDLGIVHPDAPGKFLAGIECDGATYHRSATVRDRDKLREQVLRGLGWKIVRVWSTDWWIDSNGAVKKIHAALQKELEASRKRLVS